MNDVVRAYGLGAHVPAGRKIQTTVRICAVDGCYTRLSVYNPESTCFAHQDPDTHYTSSWAGPNRPRVKAAT